MRRCMTHCSRSCSRHCSRERSGHRPSHFPGKRTGDCAGQCVGRCVGEGYPLGGLRAAPPTGELWHFHLFTQYFVVTGHCPNRFRLSPMAARRARIAAHSSNTVLLVILVKRTLRNRGFPAQGSWGGYLPPVPREIRAPVSHRLEPGGQPLLVARIPHPLGSRVPVEVGGPLGPPVRSGVEAGLEEQLGLEVEAEVGAETRTGIMPRTTPETTPQLRAGTKRSSGVWAKPRLHPAPARTPLPGSGSPAPGTTNPGPPC